MTSLSTYYSSRNDTSKNLQNISGNSFINSRNNDDKKAAQVKATSLFDLLGEDALEAKQYFKNKDDELKKRR